MRRPPARPLYRTTAGRLLAVPATKLSLASLSRNNEFCTFLENRHMKVSVSLPEESDAGLTATLEVVRLQKDSV